jgi:putative membrane protein
MMGMMLIWPVLLLVIGALLVAGVVWAVQLLSRGGSPSVGLRSAGEAPLEILQRRYAGGEITKEQFEEMRRTLGQR